MKEKIIKINGHKFIFRTLRPQEKQKARELCLKLEKDFRRVKNPDKESSFKDLDQLIKWVVTGY